MPNFKSKIHQEKGLFSYNVCVVWIVSQFKKLFGIVCLLVLFKLFVMLALLGNNNA